MLQKMAARRKSLPLFLRLSLWLIGVAILPLLLALLISEVPSRTTLINQAETLMETDAKTHARLIDNYLANKETILESLSNDPDNQQYLLNPEKFSSAQLALFVQDGLSLEKSLSPEISLVEFFNSRGVPLLNYSLYGEKPQAYGANLVPPEYLQRVLQGQQFFSGVYYDAKTQISTSQLYTPIFASATSHQVVGFGRDTLRLNNIWTIVQGENGANGSGSYAFLLDQNGVRIIDPDSRTLFTAIAPPSSEVQQQIQTQGLYGLNTRNVPVVADKTLQSIQSQSKPPDSFQEVPANQQAPFQITWQRLTTVPWTYFVSTPVSVVEAAANQQLLILLLIGLIVLIPAAVIGWIVSNRISTPILRSTDSLVKSSAILNQLAENEEKAAAEQIWIIDSSQVGLESVEYYTKASKKAIWRLIDLSKELPVREYKDQQEFQQDLDVMTGIGEYLKKAVAYQDDSNKRLSTAINLTNEVANQLAAGARSTKEVADGLDRTVDQLRKIVGDI